MCGTALERPDWLLLLQPTSPFVLPTPHIAGDVRFAHERCFREACADAVRVIEGEEPRHTIAARDTRLYEGSLDWVYG